MRKIKFRGKEIDTKEWVYGGVVHQTDYYGNKCDKYFIIDGESTYDYEMGENQLVDGNTVGQFTGLRDKNGKEIYEGDIVEFEYKSTHSKGIAKIEYALYKWKYNGCYYNQNIAVWLDICDTDVVFEVIGNIWDNPELLRGEKD